MGGVKYDSMFYVNRLSSIYTLYMVCFTVSVSVF